MVAASGAAAVANANRYTTCTPGMCLQYVRTWLEIPANYGSAIEAWNNAAHQHPGDRTPPQGAPLFWHGGGGGLGHIALAVDASHIRSTDTPTTGRVSTQPLTYIEDNWGQTYLGWTEDLNNVWITWLRVPVPTPVPPPITEESPMFMYRSPDGTKAFMVDSGKIIYMEPGVANNALRPLSGTDTKPLYFQATADFVARLEKAFGPPIQ